MDPPSPSGSDVEAAGASADYQLPAIFPPFYFQMPPLFGPLPQNKVDKPPVIPPETFQYLNHGSVYGPIGTIPPTRVPDGKIEWCDGVTRPGIDFDFSEEDDSDDEHDLLKNRLPNYNFEKFWRKCGCTIQAQDNWHTKMLSFHKELTNRLALIAQETNTDDDGWNEFEWKLPKYIEDEDPEPYMDIEEEEGPKDEEPGNEIIPNEEP